MSHPRWQTDLRLLFMTDAFTHAGVYDGFSFVLGGDGKVVPVNASDEFKRGMVIKAFREEVQIQNGIAALLLATAPPIPAAPMTDKSVLQRLRRAQRLLLSSKTLETYFQDPLAHYHSQHPFRFSLSPQIITRLNLLGTGNREIFLHKAIPDGVMLEVLPDATTVGVLNTPEYFPYPVGMGVRPKAVRAAYRLEPWRYPRPRTSS